MNEANLSQDQPQAGNADRTSALFANMVVQQTNMALMFLGQVPHPESGQQIRDLDTARLFIDQLEMLEVKTKGNLDKREEGLLKQSLTALRMAFVEAVNQEPSPAPKPAAESPAGQPAAASQKTKEAGSEPAAPASEAESRKKFSKKY